MVYEPKLVVKTARRAKPKAQKKLKSVILELTKKGWSNPDIARHPDVQLTISKSGMSQRVWQIQSQLVKEGFLKRNTETNRLERPFEEIRKHSWEKITNSDAIEQTASLKKMWKFLMDKKNGKGDPKSKLWLDNLLTICNTTNTHPDEIANAVDLDNNPAWLEKATEIMRLFNEKVQEGTIIRQTTNNTQVFHYGDSDQKNIELYQKSMRQFLRSQGFSIPELPTDHILSGSKGRLFGAYNMVGMSDPMATRLIDFTEKEAKDYGYVGAVALMPEMITRTNSLFNWIVNYQTEYDEFEGNPIDFDFVRAFHETKTEKAKSDWDKFIIDPKVRKILQEIGKERKGKTLLDLGTGKFKTKIHEAELNRICREFYIKEGILDETARLPRKVNNEKNKERTFYPTGSESYFYDIRGAYVLRHTGAHKWCRRTKYDYGFVSELGWGDMNTLKKCYAGMDLRHMLKASMCMYCNPPVNADRIENDMFCSATHAFIFYANDRIPKSRSERHEIQN